MELVADIASQINADVPVAANITSEQSDGARLPSVSRGKSCKVSVSGRNHADIAQTLVATTSMKTRYPGQAMRSIQSRVMKEINALSPDP